MGQEHRETGKKASSARLRWSLVPDLPDASAGVPDEHDPDLTDSSEHERASPFIHDKARSGQINHGQKRFFNNLQGLLPRPGYWRRLQFGLEMRGLALVDALRRDLEVRRALFLWGSVMMALGAASYSQLPDEPVLWILLALTFGIVILAYRRARQGRAYRVPFLALMGLVGLTSASFHGQFLASPVLQVSLSAKVTGIVERVEYRPSGERWTLHVESISKLPAEAWPRKLLLNRHSKGKDFHAGDRVSVRARLVPLSRPVLPGGFNYGRYLWARGIGGQGYLAKTITLLPSREEQGGLSSFPVFLERTRSDIAVYIRKRLTGDTAGLAVALSVGKRDTLSNSAKEALRQSGLAHILAISGLHMALVALSVFAGLRSFLAFLPGLALCYPIKKWAAFAALLVATGYLCLSGFAVSTIRAYVMTAIFLLAAMVGRPAFTLHNLALALICLVVLQPLAVAEAGLQMSFAATAALIAAYDRVRGWKVKKQALYPTIGGLAVQAGRWVSGWGGGVLFTALIAGIAVLPFSLVHFQQVAPLGLLANVLAMPLVSFVVMPLGLLSFLLVPLGLQAIPTMGAAWGLEQILAVAHWVTALSPVEWMVGTAHWTLPLVAVLVLSLLAIHRGPILLLGVCLFAVPLIAGQLIRPPDFWISQKGNALAFRDHEGRWQFSGVRVSRFEAMALLRADGDERALLNDLPRLKSGQKLEDGGQRLAGLGLNCDRDGCRQSGPIYVDGEPIAMTLSFVRKAQAFVEDCQRSDLVISQLPIPAGCEPRLMALGQQALSEAGARFLWISRNDTADSMAEQDIRQVAEQGDADERSNWTIRSQSATQRGYRGWQQQSLEGQ